MDNHLHQTTRCQTETPSMTCAWSALVANALQTVVAGVVPPLPACMATSMAQYRRHSTRRRQCVQTSGRFLAMKPGAAVSRMSTRARFVAWCAQHDMCFPPSNLHSPPSLLPPLDTFLLRRLQNPEYPQPPRKYQVNCANGGQRAFGYSPHFNAIFGSSYCECPEGWAGNDCQSCVSDDVCRGNKPGNYTCTHQPFPDKSDNFEQTYSCSCAGTPCGVAPTLQHGCSFLITTKSTRSYPLPLPTVPNRRVSHTNLQLAVRGTARLGAHDAQIQRRHRVCQHYMYDLLPHKRRWW